MKAPRLLADENIAAPLVNALRLAEWDVAYVADVAKGATDEQVFSIARSEGRVLLTEDKDFGELVYRLKRTLPGVILLRLGDDPWKAKEERVRAVLAEHSAALAGTYAVIERKTVRIRRMPS